MSSSSLKTTKFKVDDEFFMLQTIKEASKGVGRTSPNPPVGAVIVKNGQIIGRGYHHKAGEPHAEIVALRNTDDPREATLYVTLEPCNHFGKTPPCSHAILKAGIKRVVYAVSDPTKASGGGDFLRSNGVDVKSGVCEKEAYEQLKYFLIASKYKRPYILLKMAMTLDGKTATSEKKSKYITGKASRKLVHQWRNELDAIMVGALTVKYDNPELTCRMIENGRNPIRIIPDTYLKNLTGKEKIFQTLDKAPVYLVCVSDTNKRQIEKFKKMGVVVIVLKNKQHIEIEEMLFELYKLGINSVLLEGGATLAGSFILSQNIDELAFFYAPKLMMESSASGPFVLPHFKIENLSNMPILKNPEVKILEQDILIKGQIIY